MITFLLFSLLPFAVFAQEAIPAAGEANRLSAIEERLNRLEGKPAKTSLSALNPSIGMSLDLVHRTIDSKARFDFRSAELNIGAPMDPFAKGWVIINAGTDAVALEEAALKTTALPWNLTVTGGRFFASFGRLAHVHNHELPVIDRPTSLDRFIGGESQSDGLEVSYLFPTPFYLNAVVGTYNKLGGGNDRRTNATRTALDRFTYLGRLSTYADLGNNHSLEFGLHSAWTPKREMVEDVATTGFPHGRAMTRKTWRTLSGSDLTYRYHPVSGGLYREIVWSAEVMLNNEQRFDDNRVPTGRVKASGGFTYVMVKLGRHWRPGLALDLAEDLNNPKRVTRTYSAMMTYDVTEYQRLRLQFSRAASNRHTTLPNNIVALQWSGVLGYHVHGFRDR